MTPATLDIESLRGASRLERRLMLQWHVLGGPPLVKEYRFSDVRKWRFDFAHPATKVAIECEGGIYANSRHTRGAGFEADALKYNTATIYGWRVFRVTEKLIRELHLKPIRDLILALEGKL